MPSSLPSPTPESPRGVALRRRTFLAATGTAAVAGASYGHHGFARAATLNSLEVGGEGAASAFCRTTMPAVSDTFTVSLDYLYRADTEMANYYVWSSFDTTYQDIQVRQTGDRWMVVTQRVAHTVDQVISPDEWHRVVIEFVPGFATMYLDGQRLSSGTTTRFPVSTDATYSNFGYLGDVSTRDGFSGIGYFDNLRVTSDGQTTFEESFDDGLPRWTQVVANAPGVVRLADPARNSDVGALSAATMTAPEVVPTESPFPVRIAGTSADGRPIMINTESITLGTLPAGVTVDGGAGGYFTFTAQNPGMITLSATVVQDGATIPVSAETVVAADSEPSSLALSAPVSPTFVGDTMTLYRTVQDVGGRRADPTRLTWVINSSAPAVAEVDADGVLTALTPGTTTISATATSATGVEVTDTLEIAVAALDTVKRRASFWTTERRAVATANIARYGWAAAARDSAVAAADAIVARGPERLWDFVTSQNVPRSYALTSVEADGCINCGTAVHAHGQYPYTADIDAKPWKVTCPNCKVDFPTNDFAAYYAGGLDQNGFFDPVQAEQHNEDLIAAGGTGNLINIGQPDKGPAWGIDDGAGTILPNGNRYTPIAYYNHWKLWYRGLLAASIVALRDAYLYTGDAKYAGAGLIILDRVADIYPALNLDQWTYPDGYLNSNGNTSRGKVVGSIWETTLIRDSILAYDSFYPALADDADGPIDPEVLAFLDSKSKLMDKTNITRVRRNIEDGILRVIWPAMKRSEIRGNQGMHQSTLAITAVVLDHLPETKAMLEFNYASGVSTGYEVTGGNLGAVFVDDVDRDGNGKEAAPGYNSGWLGQFTDTADYLEGYTLTGMESYDLYANPKYLKMFAGIYPLTMMGSHTPTIGDTGAAGSPILLLSAGVMVKAFVKTGDPTYAQVAHWLNARSSAGLKLGMFDRDPEAIASRIQAVVDDRGEWNEPSGMLTGYGFAALRDGTPPPPPPANTFQRTFDALAIVEQTKGTKYFDSNGTLQFEADTMGDRIVFEWDLVQPIEGQLRIGIWQAGTYGTYRADLDGRTIVDQVSFAGGGAGERDLGEVTLAAGTHRLAFTLVAGPGTKAGFRLLTIGDVAGPVIPGTWRGSTMYFGRNRGHGHRDTHNIDHYAYGMALLPDMGYPRYANSIDMHRKSLVINTISHNTVAVDNRGQDEVVVGFPQLFDGGPVVQVVDVDTPQAYTSTERYRRSLVQVRIDDDSSYTVDLFRVQGGSDHTYSFHSMDATRVAVAGAELVPQKDGAGNYIGTYAGSDVPYDDTVDDPSGHSYFYDVDRATGQFDAITASWSEIKDTWGVSGPKNAATDVSVTLTLLGPLSDVALASCEPPQNKPGNPRHLRYLLAKSPTTDAHSVFTGLIEAHRGARLVTTVEPVPVMTLGGAAADDQDVRAVRATFADGRVDLVVHSVDPDAVYLVEGHRFQGRCGVLITRPGQAPEVHLVEGREFTTSVFAELAGLTGSVEGFTRELSQSNTVTVSLSDDETFLVTADELVGRYVFIDDDGGRNAVYRIEGVDSFDGTTAVLSIGDVTTVRQFVDPYDFDKGYVHDVAVGRACRIPLRTTAPTRAADFFVTVFEHYKSQLDKPRGAQLPVLAERAGVLQSRGEIAEARSVLQDLRGQLDNRPITSQLSTRARQWMVDIVDGWLRQLAD